MFENKRADKLTAEKVSYAEHRYGWILTAVRSFLITIFIYVVCFFVIRALSSYMTSASILNDDQAKDTGLFDSSQNFVVNDDKNATNWKSIVYDHVVAKKIADIIDFPDTFNDYLNVPSGKNHIVRNMIFYGPPGTGKSFSALALAQSLSSHYKVVAAGAMQYKYVGVGAAKWSENVQEAKKIARNNIKLGIKKPVFIIVEEIDSMCQNSSSSKDRDDTMLNTFLASIDSIEREALNIIVIGTTNHINMIADSAKRSGRLNKIYFGEPSTDALWLKRIECIKREIESIFRVFENEDQAKRLSNQKGVIIRESFWRSLREIFKNNKESVNFVFLKEQSIIQIKLKVEKVEKEATIGCNYVTLGPLDANNILSEISPAKTEGWATSPRSKQLNGC